MNLHTSILYYGDADSPYCKELEEEGLTYLRANNFEKEAELVKVRIDQARLLRKR